MLDLVPLASAGREVAEVDRETELVGEPLKLLLPDMRAIAIPRFEIFFSPSSFLIGRARSFVGTFVPPYGSGHRDQALERDRLAGSRA